LVLIKNMDKNFFTSSQKSSNPHGIMINRKFTSSGQGERKQYRPSGIIYSSSSTPGGEL
jgi:hypothetical protein